MNRLFSTVALLFVSFAQLAQAQWAQSNWQLSSTIEQGNVIIVGGSLAECRRESIDRCEANTASPGAMNDYCASLPNTSAEDFCEANGGRVTRSASGSSGNCSDIQCELYANGCGCSGGASITCISACSYPEESGHPETITK